MERRKFLGIVLVLAVGIGSGILWGANASTTGSVRTPISAVNRVKIDDSSGTVELVAAQAGKRIQVWGVTLATASSTTMEFKSASTSLTGAMSVSALQIDTPAFGNPVTDSAIPWLETATGEALNLSLGSAIKVTGQVIWTAQ